MHMTAMYERAVAHFDLDAFFVSVECLKDPSLKGRPIIVGGHPVRGVVAACSYETRRYGIHSAMPMKTALKLCPHAIILPGDRESYGIYSHMVTEIIAENVPLFEKASIDEFYLDLSGLDKFLGCYQWAAALRKKIIAKTGLPISFALSTNKLVSKIATDTVKPNGQIEVPPGTEKAFLAPLPVEKIPMVGKETAAQLHRLGIFFIRQLAETPRNTLSSLLGKHGAALWEKAQGVDHSPVVPYHEPKSISTENTLEQDSQDIDFLETELLRLNARNAFDLRRKQKFTSCVAIKLKYGNFQVASRQMTVPATASDHTLAGYVKKLFRELYIPGQPVRLLGVRYSHFRENGAQLDLFEENDHPGLYQAIDELKDKFGWESIGMARQHKKSL